ncbi:hypothetical protein [Brevibacillus sp. HD3.3A]|uniref:hypothetical protein n=1 Tax=Brevibacillus sp. HD3.3A TaxID=2738979 RepID=UPI00156AA432|nr:hypothetical protein [Brevibacillus sp. HD3.3A]UED70733.1 hypothetical protein HP435_08880 [Brevibacillus sp. HD3.3A]
MDRFAQGLPDSQEQPEIPVDECANDACQRQMYFGDKAWRYEGDLYCCGKCLAEAMGATKLTIKQSEV